MRSSKVGNTQIYSPFTKSSAALAGVFMQLGVRSSGEDRPSGCTWSGESVSDQGPNFHADNKYGVFSRHNLDECRVREAHRVPSDCCDTINGGGDRAHSDVRKRTASH